MNDIRKYSGYFIFSEISNEQLDCIAKIFSDENFQVDLSRMSLEFESTGRDDDRLVLKLFKKVAHVLKNAEGELRCEVDDEHEDPHFEFLSIRQGALLLQRGRIVREKETLVV
jgi:hypothetical protein